MVVIERGSAPPSAESRALVHDAGLPLDGLGDVPTTIVTARDEGVLVGLAAVERHSDHALLRSVVVAADRRGEGIGSRLVEAAEAVVRDQGLQGPFLLTETAAPFFADRGYDVIARDAGPAAIRASIEWATACPDTAVPMVLRDRSTEPGAEPLDLSRET